LELVCWWMEGRWALALVPFLWLFVWVNVRDDERVVE